MRLIWEVIMKALHEVEVTQNRYLLNSKAKVLALVMSSDVSAAHLRRTIAFMANQNKRYDLDLYISQALFIYTEGVAKGDSVPVILAKIEEHRLHMLGVLETSVRCGRQPFVDANVYCTDCESKIRMLLKSVCAQHIRIFLLSIRKSIRKNLAKPPLSESFPFI